VHAEPAIRGSAAAASWRTEPSLADQTDVPALLSATGMFTTNEIEIARELLVDGARAGYEFFFADHQGNLAGFACFGLIPLTEASYDLYWIAVHPAHQGRGLGRGLLSAVEDRVHRAGGERIYVDTSNREDYAPTQRFYASSGYTVVAELPDFYRPGDGKLIYCRSLASQAQPVT
jgi:ribosomal protein S18 acetylase RimI-like enzyme